VNHTVISCICYVDVPLLISGDTPGVLELAFSIPLLTINLQAVQGGIIYDVVLAGVHPIDGELVVVVL
jgi:hypothetical protein